MKRRYPPPLLRPRRSHGGFLSSAAGKEENPAPPELDGLPLGIGVLRHPPDGRSSKNFERRELKSRRTAEGVDAARMEAGGVEASRGNATRRDAARVIAAGVDESRRDATRRSAARVIAARVEAASAEGVIPPRADGPRRNPPGRGCRARLPLTPSAKVKARATEALRKGIYSASSTGPKASRQKLVRSILAGWGLQFPPLTVEGVMALGAALKAGGYRSAKLYLMEAKLEAERALTTGVLSAAVKRALVDAERSCTRGVGPAKQAESLPFRRLAELDGEERWASKWPVSPRTCLVVGCWFLLREVELANALERHVTIGGDARTPTITFLLPASKCDAMALGLERTLGCACDKLGRVLCPVHALKDHKAVLQRRFAAGGKLNRNLPLFPDVQGRAITKDNMADLIEEAARRLRLTTVRADGLPKYTGHSMRVTGAQLLVSLGLEPSVVGLFGRWSSASLDEGHIPSKLRGARGASGEGHQGKENPRWVEVCAGVGEDRGAGVGYQGLEGVPV
eukprot:5504600-Amphidinium_carterae.1